MSDGEKIARTVTGVVIIVIIIALYIHIQSGYTEKETFEQKREDTTSAEQPIYHLFRTDVQEEYLIFLSEFDENQYAIVGISNSMSVEAYGSDEFYMVTYRNRMLGDPIMISGQNIKIFLTDKEDEFFDFMEDLNKDWKIIDISTSMNLDGYGSDEFYIVTYGEN